MRCFTRFADEILWCQGCLEKSVSTTGLFISLIQIEINIWILWPCSQRDHGEFFQAKLSMNLSLGGSGSIHPSPERPRWICRRCACWMCWTGKSRTDEQRKVKIPDTCIFPFFLNGSQIDGNQRGDMKQHLYSLNSLNSSRRRVLVSKSQICKAWANGCIFASR